MDLGLHGKVVIVTGGSSGIGLAIARRFLDEGARVTISGRDAAKLSAAVASLSATVASRSAAVASRSARPASLPDTAPADDGAPVLAVPADVGEPADVARLVDATVERFGGLDVVVSNAGTHLRGTIDAVPVEQLAAHVRTKLYGPWELARRAAPAMRARGGGSFIVIIGQAGKVPGAEIIASAVTNAAQHAFVKSLADDLGRDKILVNAVCPSRIASPLTKHMALDGEAHIGRSLEQQESGWGRQVPLGHWGRPDDIADAVIFLASERARFICGANIDVDGGYQRMIF